MPQLKLVNSAVTIAMMSANTSLAWWPSSSAGKSVNKLRTAEIGWNMSTTRITSRSALISWGAPVKSISESGSVYPSWGPVQMGRVSLGGADTSLYIYILI